METVTQISPLQERKGKKKQGLAGQAGGLRGFRGLGPFRVLRV